jgi:hypothetical protein
MVGTRAGYLRAVEPVRRGGDDTVTPLKWKALEDRLAAMERRLDEILRYTKPYSVQVAEQQELDRRMRQQFRELNEREAR